MADIQRLSDTDFHFTQLKNARIHTQSDDYLPEIFDTPGNANLKGFNQVSEGLHSVWDGKSFLLNDGFIDSYHHVNYYLAETGSVPLVVNKFYPIATPSFVDYQGIDDNFHRAKRFYGNSPRLFIKQSAHYLRLDIDMKWRNSEETNDMGVTLNSMQCYIVVSNDGITWDISNKIKEIQVNYDTPNQKYYVSESVEIHNYNLMSETSAMRFYAIVFVGQDTAPILLDPPDSHITYTGLDYLTDGYASIGVNRIPNTSWTTRMNIPNIEQGSIVTINWNALLENNGFSSSEYNYISLPFSGMYQVNVLMLYTLKTPGTGLTPNSDNSASLFLNGKNGEVLIDYSPRLIPIDDDKFIPASMQGSVILPIQSGSYGYVSDFYIKINTGMTGTNTVITGGYIDFRFVGDYGLNYSKLSYNSPTLVQLPPP